MNWNTRPIKSESRNKTILVSSRIITHQKANDDVAVCSLYFNFQYYLIELSTNPEFNNSKKNEYNSKPFVWKVWHRYNDFKELHETVSYLFLVCSWKNDTKDYPLFRVL